MRELSYSPKALDTLTKFHKKSFIVYLEGKDDKPFWQLIFRKNNITSVHFKIAGGKEEIAKLERHIIEEQLEVVVARDSDYTLLTDDQYDDKRIIYTYGYSIENTLYQPESIAKTSSILAREEVVSAQEVQQWLSNFTEHFYELIRYDFANEYFGKGLKVLGDNCFLFLTSQKSHIPCEDKISNKIAEVSKEFTRAEMREVETIFDKNTREVFYLIRGHFLSNAILNYIKRFAKKSGMTHEMLYLQMMALLENVVGTEDMAHLSDQIELLAA